MEFQQNPDEEHKRILDKRHKIDEIVEQKHTCSAFAKQFSSNFKKAWKILISLLYVFTITFVVFPGTFFLSHFNFMKNKVGAEFTWYTLIVILMFNVLDTVGRKVGGIVSLSPRKVYALAFARSIFIVTTIYIALDELDGGFIETDAFKMINIIFFSFTNGFVSTLCAIQAPSFVDNDQKEQVGIYVGLFIILGITLGSIIQMPMASLPGGTYW